jgi:hypothetical protein
LVLDPLEALMITIPVGVASIVIFVTWLYPKAQHMGYWRFIGAWMAFWVAGGVVGLVVGSVTIGIGPVTALEYFLVAQVVALAMAPVVFRVQTQAQFRAFSQSS